MKKRALSIFLSLAFIAGMCCFAGCGETASDEENTAVCTNGQFVGAAEEDTGVLAFKGIPYAKAPVDDLRWKAPEPVEASDEVINADAFGKSSIQYEWHSEPITTERSEDCLTLNVWTKDLSGEGKPVMVFFHGGSFAWGGTSEELYNGQYIVNEHEDVIVVTCNYRLGMMGFIDLSQIEGGDAFPDSEELGVLDCIESLKWINENIAAFGGDPDNITIFGESAGSTMVACLAAIDECDGLFNRVICESGALNLTFSQKEFDESYQIEALLKATGAKNMDDLMALSEEELIEANELSLDEDEMTVNDYYSLPLRGNLIPDDPYEGLAKAKARGVDIIIGTNTDEISYWVNEMGEEPMTEETAEENLEVYEESFVNPNFESVMEQVTPEEKKDLEKFMELTGKEQLWARSALLTEGMFRAGSIKEAEEYAEADGEGKVYMYYFGKGSDKFDFVGAGHAAELSYVFHNLEEDAFCGTIDEALADSICEAWVNFAKTGDPSTETAEWTTYDTKDRNTMVIGDDSSMKMVSDPDGEARELTKCLTKYNLWSVGA